jgi:hypothetical protein
MRNIFIFIVLSIVILTNIGCEEDFSPRTTYKERYILNCIIRGDTSLQTATLAHTYNVEGYDPYVNTEDPFIGGADIRIWHKDDVYFFHDSTIDRTDTSRYNAPMKFYYNNNFKPGTDDPIEIRAVLLSGKILLGFSKLPKPVKFDLINSDKRIPSQENPDFRFIWQSNTSITWYLARLQLYYYKIENGVQVRKSIEVPAKYDLENGVWTTVYPKPSRTNRALFSNAALDYVMNKISEGDLNKSDYTILGAVLELLIFDENLSKYYSSLNGFLDDYTIRVDQADYTNIEGGFGIFASYIKQQSGAGVEPEYVQSFGYKSNIP